MKGSSELFLVSVADPKERINGTDLSDGPERGEPWIDTFKLLEDLRFTILEIHTRLPVGNMKGDAVHALRRHGLKEAGGDGLDRHGVPGYSGVRYAGSTTRQLCFFKRYLTPEYMR